MTILLCGCKSGVDHSSGSITFYYVEQEYSFGNTGSVIAAEARESSGHRRDLSYMMALYLLGPVEEEHSSPIPSGTRIQCSTKENGGIQLKLTEEADVLSDAEFSLAASCLSLTCFNITNAPEVTIISKERRVTFNRNNLILSDNYVSYPTMEEK